ncbi:MAG: chromosome segregation protein SMC [Acidimicrobiales bacterium]
MFLKSLTLKGFKSFADPTTIELEPGITVVVGPNGSGKSNVVDAIAWVLGAQGPKVVRSTKMDDVIFAGTSNRPALGRAEVSLTIDNGSRRLPLDVAEVTITRTLFRTGESEYALNGAACRLLDIQELLSDAGVGRQQHVIVSQGQLDSVLQARPEDRRMVIEEAAGVLKFRRRRERAERRLESSEQNLLRLQDLQREVRRQLRPLERQAEAARRHDGLASELKALRLHLAGKELSSLGRRLENAEGSHAELSEKEAAQRAELARSDELVASTESAVTELQAWEGAERLGRAERLLERQRGVTNVVAERRRTVAGALAASLESDVVASLEAESSRLASELAAAGSDATELAPERERLQSLEAELRRDEAAFAAAQTADGSADESDPTGRATATATGPSSARSIRRERDDSRARLSAAGEAVARLAERLASFERMREEHELRLAELAATLEAVGAGDDKLRSEYERLVVAQQLAEAREQESELRAREATDRLHALEARAEALQSALDETRARAGVKRLEGLKGVLGTLADLVAVDDGCERAFEAAVEDTLGTVVVDGASAAREALRHLQEAGLHGGVLPAGGPQATLSPQAPLSESVAGRAELLRGRVRSSVSGVDVVLDRLLAGVLLCRGGLSEALGLAEQLPGSTIVTAEGDRLSARGWRIGAARSGATRTALEAVQGDSEAAGALAKTAAAEAERDRQAVDAARLEVAEATRRLDSAIATRNQAEAARATLAQRLEQLASERDDAASAHEAALGLFAAAQSELDLRESELARAEGAETEALAAAQAAARNRKALDDRARSLASLRAELGVRAAGLEERRRVLTERRDEVERRLAGLDAARAEATGRRESLEATERALGRLAIVLSRLGEQLEAACDRLRAERAFHERSVATTTEHLRRLRDERAVAERGLEGLRELLQRAELERAEARLRLETATETLRRELDCEPDEAIAALCPELPPGTPAHVRVRELDRELRLMGPVNPLALEELAALEERDRFLAEQLEDVRGARRELGRVIRAVDEEIVGVFAQAFADVARHFETLFAMLFPGGTGRLSLVDPEDLLSTGIEIEARPAGRNVRRLSLLSGGERSLVALAFLFAVFRSRPSPFYVMDEVEAALDDVNLHRFLDLVDEFRADAQLIVVSHQKRTMEAADVLYGVTMQAGGASKVVSERIGNPSAKSAALD